MSCCCTCSEGKLLKDFTLKSDTHQFSKVKNYNTLQFSEMLLNRIT